MSKARVGVVVVASKFEDPNEVEKAEARLTEVTKNLQSVGLDVASVDSKVMTHTDAIGAAEKLSRENLDLLVMIQGTWFQDTYQIAMIKNLNLPLVIWALPYPLSYSLAGANHLTSILNELDIYFKFVYGETNDKEVAGRISGIAKVAMVIKKLRSCRIGVLGPFRPMWRVSGPMDANYDEIDFRMKFGPEIVHIDISELLDMMKQVPDDAVKSILKDKENERKLGIIEVKEGALSDAVKAYVGMQDLMKKHALDAVGIRCYPNYIGLVCLASSWMADEGKIVFCEGDIADISVAMLMKNLTEGSFAIGELVTIDMQSNALVFRHCGNPAASLAEEISEIHLSPVTENQGVVIQFPMKSTPVTVVNLSGRMNTYKMFIAAAESIGMDQKEWSELGKGFVYKLRFQSDAREVLERAIKEGVDHHWIVFPGDFMKELVQFCRICKIRAVEI